MLQRVEVSCKALRNKLKIHLEAVHQPDQVEEFGPLFHQGTERFEAGNLIERKLYRVSNHHNPSLSIMEFERNTLMLNFLLGGGEWIKETDREYQSWTPIFGLKRSCSFQKESPDSILYRIS